MLNPNLQMTHEPEGRADLETLLGSLLSVLRKEVEVYGELAEAVALEADILRRPSLESLHESNARKETCILKSRLLEEVRLKTVGRIASALGLDEEGLTLQAILPHAQGGLGRDLRDCHRELRALAARIREANRRNGRLLDASLEGVRAGTEFLGSLLGGGATYLDSGALKQSGLSGRICSERG
ncbi:MAG: flagellar protein FlgN [Syntrophaceae bacterium]|nr:flagellar protein FlgN [Syntrophaceae bacterium]